MRVLNSFLVTIKKMHVWLERQIRLVRVGAKRGNPMYVGIGSTKLFLTFVGVMALLFQKEDDEWSWRIWSFLTSPSNEIGDTLAGIAGALAFLWIIVTVMLQSKELAAQRDELRLTRIEFAAQRKATENMARIMGAQAEMAEADQKDSLARRSDAFFEALLPSFLKFFNNESLPSWDYFVPTVGGGGGSQGRISFEGHFGSNYSTDRAVTIISEGIQSQIATLDEMIDEGKITKFPTTDYFPQELEQKLKEIADLFPVLSPAQQIRMNDLQIAQALDALRKLHSTQYWHQEAEQIK